MAKQGGRWKKAGKYRSAITGRFVTSKQTGRYSVTEEGVARLRERGASEEFLNAARGKL